MRRDIVTLICLMTLLLVALPCGLLGFFCLLGAGADMSRQENFKFGIQLFAIAAFPVILSTVWFLRLTRKRHAQDD